MKITLFRDRYFTTEYDGDDIVIEVFKQKYPKLLSLFSTILEYRQEKEMILPSNAEIIEQTYLENAIYFFSTPFWSCIKYYQHACNIDETIPNMIKKLIYYAEQIDDIYTKDDEREFLITMIISQLIYFACKSLKNQTVFKF